MKGLAGRIRALAGGRPAPFDPSWNHLEVGRWGEEWAAWHYWRRRGAAILARNWRAKGGELDLVVREGGVLVFVEVKTRDANDPQPLAAVRDDRRRRHFRAAADAYVESLPRPHPPIRFDVLLVTPDPTRPSEPQVDCLEDVFAEPEEGV